MALPNSPLVVAPEQATVLQVANARFNGIAPLQRLFEPTRVDAPFLPGLVDGDVRHVNAPVTQVHKHFLGAGAAEGLGLLQAGLERVPAVGVAGETARAQHEVALVGHGDVQNGLSFGSSALRSVKFPWLLRYYGFC